MEQNRAYIHCRQHQHALFCGLHRVSNATFAFSDVSKSSSYEAAKEAYNKAQAVEKATETVKQELTDYKTEMSTNLDSITHR